MNNESIIRRLCRMLGKFDYLNEIEDQETYDCEDVRNILEQILYCED